MLEDRLDEELKKRWAWQKEHKGVWRVLTDANETCGFEYEGRVE